MHQVYPSFMSTLFHVLYIHGIVSLDLAIRRTSADGEISSEEPKNHIGAMSRPGHCLT